MTIKFGVLDQSPVFYGETAKEAFEHTIELAQQAESLGYYRFWVSEHHDSDQLAGSSPEVLMSYLLSKTQKIRIGSGGVMLQHYSPYKVAENFNVLANLAPGRVDLGIGRAPGGLPRSSMALQQELYNGKKSLTEKLIELQNYLQDDLPTDHPLFGLKAHPLPLIPAEMFLLGASPSSAECAARLGIPYVFAFFINGDPSNALESFKVYRNQFISKKGSQPYTIFALSLIVADTTEEAAELSSEMKQFKVKLESGQKVTLGSLEKAEEYGLQSGQPYTIEESSAKIVHGTKETVREALIAIKELYEVDEIIVSVPIKDFRKRLHSFELLQRAFVS
jgi:luciferase family oxidoreductase group 1